VPFEKKKGIVPIAAGKTLTASLKVTPSFLPSL